MTDAGNTRPAGEVLRLDRVGKTYPGPPAVTAVDALTVTVDAGELLALIGPSGSGKTTMLHLMGTLDVPTTGRVVLAGQDLTGLDDTEISSVRAHHIGFVFQHFALLPSLTAAENIETALLYQGVPSSKRASAARAAMQTVGLGHRADHRPNALSGGEQQRVAIARALAGNPTIVLADEPTGNLDSAAGQGILDLLVELNERGTTVAVVTHDPEVAARASRQIELRDGRLVSDSRRPMTSTRR
jgi:putative ABC transport system ATP-binding protein